MPNLTNGSNVTLTVAAGQILTVQSDGATFDFENPVGTRVGEYGADTVFGPFAAAGSVKVTSIQGAVFYELASPSAGGVSQYNPASVAITGGTISGVNNLAATQLYKFRAALARQATGGAFTKIALIGDSTTAGALSGTAAADNRPNSWGVKLAALLTASGAPAAMTNAIGNGMGPSGTGLAFNSWDSRLSSSGSFAFASANLMAGGMSVSGFAAGTVSFAPGVSTDSVDLYFYDQAGSFTVNVDGGASLGTVTLGGTNLPSKATITYAAGVHTINVVWASGNFNFLGFDAYTSTSPQIHLLNLGSGSAQAQSLAANSAAYSPIPWYKFIAPDLSIISLGINDWIGGTSQSLYTTSLQTIITNCQVSGDVILMTPFPSDASQATLANQALYVASMRALAQTNGVVLIDENYNLVSKALMTTRGLGADVNHPNGLGHSVIARDIKNVLAGLI